MPVALALVLYFSSCQQSQNKQTAKQDNETNISQNKAYQTFTIKNTNGMQAKFCENGARIISLLVPDKNNKLVDVVVGFENAADYDTATEPYFGATIGRYGNRIADGKFSLEGKDYQLTINNGKNTLHGGTTGFQYQKWEISQPNDETLICRLVSPDGDNGFPGKLTTKVTYSLTDKNELTIDYEATTDKTTVVNLTNHAFFNLNGAGSILNHTLQINADQFTPVDSTLIPVGKHALVENTPFDFRQSTTIGKRINEKNEQLLFGKGYDHNYVLNNKAGINTPIAKVLGDKTNIEMQIFTTEPGLQFYSGNFMQGKNKLRNGTDDFRTAFCLETQHFPDSPNQVSFPSTVLKPNQTYRSKSVYAFSVAK